MYLRYLDGIKGLLCIWVILFHYTYRYTELFGESFALSFQNGGKVGVCIFFVITGYLTNVTIDKYDKYGSNYWLKAKLFRLYPSYFVSCIFIFLFLTFFPLDGRSSFTFLDLLQDLLMLPFLSGKIEGAHWYVLALVKFYLLFYFVARYKLYNKRTFYIFVVFLNIICSLLNQLDIFPKVYNYLFFLTFNFFNISIFTGLLLAKSMESKKYLPILCVAIMYLSVKIHLFYTPLILFIIYSLLNQKKYSYIAQVLLQSKPLLFLGIISYTWYLLHQNIGYVIMQVQLKNGINKEVTPYLTLLITLIAAYFIESFLIKPFNRLLYLKLFKNDQN